MQKLKFFLATPIVLVALFGIFIALSPSTSYARVSVGQETFNRGLGDDNYNKEKFDFQSMHGVAASANVLLLGCDPKKNCPKDLQTGAIQGAGNLVASLYTNPPASGVTYMASVFENMGLVQPAYAQNTGFNALSQGILPLWRAFRNITYFFFVIFFIATGFAIMFRAKLSPQAVITIQSALPRVIIALILITFSYAIAGFMIDLMYVLIFIFIQFFASERLITQPGEFQQQLIRGGFFGAVGAMLPSFQAIDSLFVAFREMTGNAIKGFIGGIPGGITLGDALGWVVGGAGTVIVGLLIAIALLFAIIRIFFTLLMSYISIIALVIFAPFLILFDALPLPIGVGFGMWFKNLVANILVFPVTAVLIIVGQILVRGETVRWVPPLLPTGTSSAIAALIGLGMLLFIGQVINRMKAAIQAVSFEREIEGATQATGGAATWAPRSFGEEAIRREANLRAPGSRLWGTIQNWGRRARRWAP